MRFPDDVRHILHAFAAGLAATGILLACASYVSAEPLPPGKATTPLEMKAKPLDQVTKPLTAGKLPMEKAGSPEAGSVDMGAAGTLKTGAVEMRKRGPLSAGSASMPKAERLKTGSIPMRKRGPLSLN